MSRYNTNTPRKKAVTHEGAKAYSQDAKLELIGILATGFQDTFYEKLTDREQRFKDLIDKIAKKDPEFVAKALIYTRATLGNRSVSQFGSVALAPYLSGTSLGKRFYSKRIRKGNEGGIVYRLDDMLEIIACYQALNPGKTLPNSMKKGFKAALETADTYELAKYQGKGKSVSLVDAVNLVHPKPVDKMQETFKLLMNGDLKQMNTVEDKNTTSGQKVAAKLKSGEITKDQAAKELKESKQANYSELIMEGKIGYLALLRNLRNIIKTSLRVEVIDRACEILTNKSAIKKSLVLPHQIDLALEILVSETSVGESSKFIVALNKAYELAIPNLKEVFTHGRTAVVFDTSASMTGNNSLLPNGKKTKAPIEKAALIAATLGKGIDADVYHFASGIEKVKYNPLDTVNTIKNQFKGLIGAQGHGTRVDLVFRNLKGKYDRIFLISDLQSQDYVTTTTYIDTHVYSVDLVGYRNSSINPRFPKVYPIKGYSSEIYELIKKMEIDPKALMKDISAIEI